MYGATIVYEWNGHKKPIGGGFYGTPPELDFALSTICVIIRVLNSNFFYTEKNSSRIFTE